MTLDRPLIILGAARSGTTLLGDEMLAPHPAFAYWKEPIFIWRYGAAYRRSDVRLAEEATPKVRHYIRGRLAAHVREEGGGRLLEKTPSNCFRVPFMREVLPEARFVHLVRDGRDVALSAVREWQGGGDQSALDSPELRQGGAARQIGVGVKQWARLQSRVDDWTSLRELPSYAGRFAGYVTRKATGTGKVPWGPRFPGLAETRRVYSLLETCAIQWEQSVRAVQSACHDLGSDRLLEIRYEDMTRDPAGTLSRIFGFAEIDTPPDLLARLADGVVHRSPSWLRKMDAGDVTRVERLVASTLTQLGYPLSTEVQA